LTVKSIIRVYLIKLYFVSSNSTNEFSEEKPVYPKVFWM